MKIVTPLHTCSLLLFLLFITVAPLSGQRTIDRQLTNETFNTSAAVREVNIRQSVAVPIAGQQEINADRLKQIPAYEVSSTSRKLDASFREHLKEEEKESTYKRSREIAEQNIRITRPAVEKVSVNNLNALRITPDVSEGISGELKVNPVPPNPQPAGDPNQTPKPDISWKALTAGDCSSDVGLSVSTTHVVVTTRTTVGFYDRAGNSVKAPFYIGELFNWLDADGYDYYFDTRSIYDSYRNRFWIGVLAGMSKPGKDGKARKIFCCAVSKTQNPLDGFYTYFWYSGKDVTDGNDYPTLGISKDVFTETNTGAPASGAWYANVCMFDANSLANGVFKAGWRFYDFTNPATNQPVDFHVQAVVQQGSNDYTYFVGKQANDLVLFGIKNPLTPQQSVSAWRLSFATNPFVPTVPGEQKDGKKNLWFENLSNFIFSATALDNQISLVMTVGKDWLNDGTKQTSIRLIRIKKLFGIYFYSIDRTFGLNSKIDDAPTAKIHYGFPGIAVNGNNDMVITYCRSGKTIYPEMRVSGWKNGAADIKPSRLVKAGEKAYAVSYLPDWTTWPWADCSGASADPADKNSVWIASTYASSAADNNWQVWVARVKL